MKRLPFWRGIARILSQEGVRQEVRSFGRWSLVAPFVMAILFACGQVALVRPTGMAAADTGSLIQADYSLWPAQAFAPLAEEIIPEIQREQGQLPEQIVVAGDYFPGPAVTPPPATPIAMLAPPTSIPDSPSNPAPPTVTPAPPNPPSQNSPARTAPPTRTLPPAPYPGPGKTATSTWRPAATATRTPSRTPLPSPTRTPTQPQPLLTGTASLTPSLTPSPTHSATPTQATATLTRTPTQTIPPSSTTTATSTFTPTPTLTSTATPTQTSLPSMTPTSTLIPTTPWMPPNTYTPTFTPSPTDTPSPTSTKPSTPTPTPTSTDTPTPTALPLPPNIDIGDPDGEINDIQCGTGELVDLGAQVWIGTLILYEFYNPGGCNGGICLDWIIVDLSDSAEGPWTQVFYWGDANGGNNGNVQPYHFPGGVELDNENIPVVELLDNSGILIGVGGTYRYVRLTAPNPCGDPAQVDSIDYLP